MGSDETRLVRWKSSPHEPRPEPARGNGSIETYRHQESVLKISINIVGQENTNEAHTFVTDHTFLMSQFWRALLNFQVDGSLNWLKA